MSFLILVFKGKFYAIPEIKENIVLFFQIASIVLQWARISKIVGKAAKSSLKVVKSDKFKW